jgi:hypothetical protein
LQLFAKIIAFLLGFLMEQSVHGNVINQHKEINMTTDIKHTDTQRAVLLQAAERADGNVEPMSPQLKGGARQKVIDGLTNRGLVKAKRNGIFLTDAGYAAVNRSRPKVEQATDISRHCYVV